MNRHQRLLLDMLNEIKHICEKNDITFFLGQGTLIGAMRNGGFLPWDDDADILMTYDNLEKFKMACETDLPPNRHFGAFDICETHTHLVPRYTATDTTAIHTYQSLHDDAAGEPIDFFVLDPIADPSEFDAYMQDLYLYSTVANYANVAAYKVELDPELYAAFRKMERERGHAHVAKELERRLASHFGENGDYFAYRWNGATMLVERQWFSEAVYVPFEDTEMPVPAWANEYLSMYYGDEWFEVPARPNPAKHNTAASLDFPYSEALEFYRPKVSRSALREAMNDRKYSVLKNAPANNALADERERAKARLFEHEVAAALERDPALLDAGSEALDRLVEKYIRLQTSASLVGKKTAVWFYRYLNPVVVDVDVRIVERALEMLVARGNVKAAARVIEVREAARAEASPAIAETGGLIAEYRSARNDFFHERFEEGATKARRLVERRPGVSAFRWILCMHLNELQKRSGSESDRQALLEAAQEASALFPHDGRFAKARADWLYAEGRTDEARELDLRAAESTRDGLALREIAERTGYHPAWEREPRWAVEAGVPQWSGETPKPLEEDGEAPQDSPTPGHDEIQEYLLALTAEVTATCARLGVKCMPGPALTKALANGTCLPASEKCYTVVCERNGYRRLVEELLANPPENRRLAYVGNSPLVGGVGCRYYGTDSLLLDFDQVHEPECPALFVNVVPCEPEKYPRVLGLMLRASRKAAKLAGQTDLRGVDAAVGAFGAVSSKARLGKRLFNKAMRAKPGKPCVRADEVKAKVPKDAFDDTVRVERGGHEFDIASDSREYCEKVRDRAFGPAFSPGAKRVATTLFDYGEFKRRGLLDPAYFDRKRKMSAAGTKNRVTMRIFRQNFNEIKAAVAKKAEAVAKSES